MSKPADVDYRVLIETYWNVNFVDFPVSFLVFVVLIETYWNVNDIWDYIRSEGIES